VLALVVRQYNIYLQVMSAFGILPTQTEAAALEALLDPASTGLSPS